jgi:hypothetical protein
MMQGDQQVGGKRGRCYLLQGGIADREEGPSTVCPRGRAVLGNVLVKLGHGVRHVQYSYTSTSSVSCGLNLLSLVAMFATTILHIAGNERCICY